MGHSRTPTQDTAGDGPTRCPPTRRAGRAGSASLTTSPAAAGSSPQRPTIRRRGEYEGARVLGTRTVEYMTKNHLPGNADRGSFGIPVVADAPPERGQGYGLGVGVTVDPVAHKVLAGTGSYGWSGAANTYFWIDPAENLTVMFLTQLVPYAVHPIEARLSQLVYQAIVD
jgi:CubicO group peptidase (beta-lactamase class C family)